MASKKETNNFYKDLDTTDIRNRLISCLNRMLKRVLKNVDENGLPLREEKKSKNNFFDFKGNSGEKGICHIRILIQKIWKRIWIYRKFIMENVL